jgi:hypothetical protein
LHSAPRGNADRDKSLANAVATLQELVHYGRPGSHYPGEPSLGVPPFHGDNAPFAQTHLLRLGDALSRRDWNAAVDTVAEFLYCSAFVPEAQLFETGRDASESSPEVTGRGPPARSYDVLSLGAGSHPLIARVVRRTGLDVVRLWREGRGSARDAAAVSQPTAVLNALAAGPAPSSTPLEAVVKQKLVECSLAVEHLHREALEILTLEVGCDPEEFVRRLIADPPTAEAGEGKPESGAGEAVFARIEQTLRRPTDVGNSDSLCARMAARLAVRGGSRTETFLESIRAMTDDPALRVEGARHMATTAIKLLQEMRHRLTAQSTKLRGTAVTFGAEAGAPVGDRLRRSRLFAWAMREKDPRESRRQVLMGFAANRLNEALCHLVADQVHLAETRIATLVEQLGGLVQRLELLSKPFEEAVEEASDGGDDAPPPTAARSAIYQQMLREQLHLGQHEIACRVEKVIDAQVLNGAHGLRRFLESGSEPHLLLSRPLASEARRAVLDYLTEIVCRFIEAPPADTEPDGASGFTDLIRDKVTAGNHGPSDGASDRVLIVPQNVELPALRERLRRVHSNVAVVGAATSDATLCTLCGEVSLEQVARELMGGVEIFEDLASRLHTRMDVEWSALANSESRDVPAVEASTDSALLTHTAVIPVPKA